MPPPTISWSTCRQIVQQALELWHPDNGQLRTLGLARDAPARQVPRPAKTALTVRRIQHRCWPVRDGQCRTHPSQRHHRALRTPWPAPRIRLFTRTRTFSSMTRRSEPIAVGFSGGGRNLQVQQRPRCLATGQENSGALSAASDRRPRCGQRWVCDAVSSARFRVGRRRIRVSLLTTGRQRHVQISRINALVGQVQFVHAQKDAPPCSSVDQWWQGDLQHQLDGARCRLLVTHQLGHIQHPVRIGPFIPRSTASPDYWVPPGLIGINTAERIVIVVTGQACSPPARWRQPWRNPSPSLICSAGAALQAAVGSMAETFTVGTRIACASSRPWSANPLNSPGQLGVHRKWTSWLTGLAQIGVVIAVGHRLIVHRRMIVVMTLRAARRLIQRLQHRHDAVGGAGSI